MTPGPETAPYEQLAEMIEHELELANEGRLDALALAVVQRVALTETLPAVPPAGARIALERIRLLNDNVTIDGLRLREGVIQALTQLQAVRRAADGYRPAPPRRYSTNA